MSDLTKAEAKKVEEIRAAHAKPDDFMAALMVQIRSGYREEEGTK